MRKLTQYFQVYAAILGTYLLLDGIWLGIIANAEYQAAIGYIMRDVIPMWPWVTFYLMYSACILQLCVYSNDRPTYFTAICHGALLGLASYGAFNLTNYAIIYQWPLDIVVKDWMWGIFLTIASSVAGTAVRRAYTPDVMTTNE